MINKDEIVRGLKELGLSQGDTVLLHSSLASMGQVAGGATATVEAFLSVLGPSGTLVVPIFEDGMGVIADAVRDHPSAVRSVHPLACVAAIGGAAVEICRDHWKAQTAHTQDTPYLRIAERGGYVCLLGVDQDRNTTLHTVEALLRLPYLVTTPSHTFATPEGEKTKSWPYFPGPHRDFIGLDPMLRESGKMKMATIGTAVVRLIKAQDLIDVTLEAGRRNPAFVLCDNPNCPDCVPQRAAIRKAAFGRESSTLAASAALAGRYPEEIADQCKAAGIAAVELDALRSRPLTMLKPDAIAKAIGVLRAEGLQVVSLRTWTVSDQTPKLIELAKEQHIPRIIVPLAECAIAFAPTARDAGIALSFCNTDLGSEACSDMLVRMREQGLSAGFTFNGANFARCGELPFLFSYKKKLRRFVDQLDVVDGTYDGTPQPLARGNAEIKEMISILRCASFSGCMVLTEGNLRVGTLTDAVSCFDRLLQNM